MIEFNTRAEAKLDLILTNSIRKIKYMKPKALAPIASSDHNCILWKANRMSDKDKGTTEARKVRPIKDSCLRAFGRLIQNQN